jgi:endoglucanase
MLADRTIDTVAASGRLWRILMWIGLCVVFLACDLSPAVAAAQSISLQGKTFYKDGRPWIAKGVHVGAFSRPMVIPSAPKWMNDSAAEARKLWGDGELNAIRNKLHADTLRFDVSQPALDPRSAIYDPHYLDEVLATVRAARSAGFLVIAVMNAQAPSGLPNLPCMPNDSTIRAWETLAPGLAHDKGVLLELFNEPCKPKSAQGDWARGMQPVIDTIRRTGSTNILLLDGLLFARVTSGLFALVHDKMPNGLALAIHPYLVKGWFVTEKQWRSAFGDDAETYPMIVTEWNALATGGSCVGSDTPAVALSLIRYLESLRLGIVGWGIDSKVGLLVKDHSTFELSDYSSFRDCNDGSLSGGGRLLANYPND